MSSTNRGAQRVEHDYYVTPTPYILRFLQAWTRDDEDVDALLREGIVFDPCAGGNRSPVAWEFKAAKGSKAAVVYQLPPMPMAYPDALRQWGRTRTVHTMDIREDSPAVHHGDILTVRLESLPEHRRPNLFITNPPFALALDIVQHCLKGVSSDGYVAMMLRLNFLASKGRKAFFDEHPPQRTYVFHDRPSFLPDGSTDSIEYMHAVWRKGHPASAGTILKII